MKIPKKIKTLFENTPYISLATSDKEGRPNVVAIGAKKIAGSNTIWIIDTYFNKTKRNILNNKQVAICFWKDSSEGYQIKGTAKYYTKGGLFNKAQEWILKSKPDKKVKGVVEMKVTSIFSIAARPGEAGRKIV